MSSGQEPPIQVFISYSHDDWRWFDKGYQYPLIPWLEKVLGAGGVTLWYDRSDENGLQAGDEFRRRIEDAIDGSRVALLLMSESFFASEFIRVVELPRILARAQRGELALIPVLLEPCNWRRFESVSQLQIIPGEPTPLVEYTLSDRDWTRGRQQILDAIRLRVEKQAAAPRPPSRVGPPADGPHEAQGTLPQPPPTEAPPPECRDADGAPDRPSPPSPASRYRVPGAIGAALLLVLFVSTIWPALAPKPAPGAPMPTRQAEGSSAPVPATSNPATVAAPLPTVVLDLPTVVPGQAFATPVGGGATTLDQSPALLYRLGLGSLGCAAWSPDGKLLAVSSSRGLQFYDAAGFSGLRALRAQAPLATLAFSPDSQVLAAVEGGTAVGLWDVASGEELRSLTGHADAVTGLAFSPDGQLLATCSRDATVMVWDTAGGEAVHTFGPGAVALTAVAYSPDGKYVISGDEDGVARVWDLAAGQENASLPASDGAIRGLATLPDGKTVAIACEERLKLWDVASGAVRYLQETETSWGLKPDSVAVSADGKTIIAGSRAYGAPTLRAWDAGTGQDLMRFERFEGEVHSLALSPDGRIVALCDQFHQTVTLVDVASGNTLATLTGYAIDVLQMAFSEDGTGLVSTGSDGNVNSWEVASGRLLRSFGTHYYWYEHGVAFSHDASALALDGDLQIDIWDVASGKLKRGIQDDAPLAFHTLALSHDGGTLVASAGYTVTLWNATSGARLRSLSNRQAVRAFALAPDGKTLALAHGDSLTIWDVDSDREVRTFYGVNPGAGLAYSPDGRAMATGDEGRVKLWDTETGQVVRELDAGAQVSSLAYAQTGITLAAGCLDGAVSVWDASTGQKLRAYQGHAGAVMALAFSGDGRTLATGGGDGTIALRDLARE